MNPGDLDIDNHSWNCIEIYDKFKKGIFSFAPGFVIDNSRESEYIESILIGAISHELIGIKRFYGDPYRCVYELHDGKKRISAIIRFMNDEFSLKGLSVMTACEGKKFSELHPALRRVIHDAYFDFILLSYTHNNKDVTDEAIKRFL